MKQKTTAVHVTHEAIGKIGGIGAVLEGLFTSDSYLEAVDRSILVSPMFNTDGDVSTRLGADGEVLYSSIDGMVNSPYYDSFHHIENTYNVNIAYGRRCFIEPLTGKKSYPEVILIEMSRMADGPLNDFKAKFKSYPQGLIPPCNVTVRLKYRAGKNPEFPLGRGKRSP